MKTATAVMNDCYTSYLPSTASSRCSKNVVFLQLGSRYLSRLLSPDSEETQKREKEKRPEWTLFRERRDHFKVLKTPLLC